MLAVTGAIEVYKSVSALLRIRLTLNLLGLRYQEQELSPTKRGETEQSACFVVI